MALYPPTRDPAFSAAAFSSPGDPSPSLECGCSLWDAVYSAGVAAIPGSACEAGGCGPRSPLALILASEGCARKANCSTRRSWARKGRVRQMKGARAASKPWKREEAGVRGGGQG